MDEAQTPPGTRTTGRRLAVQVLLAVAVLAVVYLGLRRGLVWSWLRKAGCPVCIAWATRESEAFSS